MVDNYFPFWVCTYKSLLVADFGESFVARLDFMWNVNESIKNRGSGRSMIIIIK